MQSIIAVTNKHTAKLHHVGSLYILTYDARKLKHKNLILYNWLHVSARCVLSYYYIKFKTEVCLITHKSMLFYDARLSPTFYAEAESPSIDCSTLGTEFKKPRGCALLK